MRMILLLLTLTLFAREIHAQELELTQSSPDLTWETISNDFVKLIYPTQDKGEAAYIANLVEHYSSVVGETYQIKKPLLFTLVMRSEVAGPNGFVALGPRRSEWFSSSNFTSLIGSSEWYQTLAIHEYRHVLQFDHYNRGFVKILDYLFGDTGQALGLFAGLHPWYFEGDAVWAETKYTDAGRGRSPRFMARLKALVLSDQIPTYDQFVNHTYNNQLPNHYIYGFVLVSRATQKFGDDFWMKVTRKVASIPHPFRIYSAFKDVSGQDFYQFYQETMNDLKTRWKMEVANHSPENLARSDYRENLFPHREGGALYYLNYSLDSYWTLIKREGENKTKVAELAISPDIGRLSYSKEFAAFTQFLPDSRYGFKGSSDLVLVNLKNGASTKITKGMRLYYPAFAVDGKSIFATHFTSEQDWKISQFSLEGELLRSVGIKDHKISQVAPLSADLVAVIMNDLTGQKLIALVNLKTNQVQKLTKPSRNNLNNLTRASASTMIFEAQHYGAVNIFKLDLKGVVSQCTNDLLGAYTPSLTGETIYYSNQDYYGSHISTAAASNCKVLETDLFSDYLGDGPSDNYNKFTPRSFDNQKALASENKYEAKSYGDFDRRLFIPHSWSFIGGNGFALTAQTDNYLRTLSLFASFGEEAAEDTEFASFKIDIKKFYPVISLNGGMRDREIDLFNSNFDLEWKEKSAGLDIAVPFISRHGLYNLNAVVSGSGDYLEASNYRLEGSGVSDTRRIFYRHGGEFQISLAKDLTYRSIYSPWAISYLARYDVARSLKDDDLSSYRLYQGAAVHVPGLFDHNVIRLLYSQEKTSERQSAYKFIPFGSDPTGAVFSRGYEYETVAEYRKLSGNYVTPLAYPDMALGGWYYLRRIQGNIFFDSTAIESPFNAKTLNSTGLEVELESQFFRRVPFNLGGRYIYKFLGESQVGEFYLGVNIAL